MKKNTLLIPILAMSILLLPFHGGQAAHAQPSKKTQDVIVFYKNKTGKQTVLSTSQKIEHQFNSVKAVSVKVDARSLTSLQTNKNIAFVEKNIKIKTLSVADKNSGLHALTPSNGLSQWSLKDVNAQEAWREGYTGQGVKVAVIDTGIGPNTNLHVVGGVSEVPYTKSYADDNGHGTHVAGIIAAKQNSDMAGVAPNVSLYAVKALDYNGEADMDNLIGGINWAIANKMDIINLSLGTSENSRALETATDAANKAGILVVAAAGNNGISSRTGDTIDYPAKYASVIGVTAVDSNMKRGSFSSTGPEAEVAAPGVDIISTFPHDKFAEGSGTSQAAPHVTGMLALLKQAYPTMTNVQLRTLLDNFYTKDIGAVGKDPFYGYGFVNFMPKSDLASEESAKAEAAVTTAEQTRTQDNLDEANNLIQLLPVGSEKKNQLQSRLIQVASTLPEFNNARVKVALANAHHNLTDIENAQKAVLALPDSPDKTVLLNQVKADLARNVSNGKNKVSQAEKAKTRASINAAKAAISQIKDANVTKALKKRLDRLESVLVSVAAADVKRAERTKTKKNVDAAIRATHQLPSGAKKSAFQKRINKVESVQVLRAKLDIMYAQKVHTKRSYFIAQHAINNLQKGQTKHYFQSWLKGLQA